MNPESGRKVIFDSTTGYLRFLIWGIFAVISLFNVWASHQFSLLYIYPQDLLFAIIICWPFIMISFVLREQGKVRTANIIEIAMITQIYAVVFVFFQYVCVIFSAYSPYYDQYLLAFDRALGLDWPVYVAWLDRHPDFIFPLAYHYSTFLYQFSIILLGLTFFKKNTKVYSLILASVLVCFICVVISAFIANDQFVTYTHLDMAQFTNHFSTAGYAYIPTMHQLREGKVHLIHIAKREGLVNFPSYHASFAILCMWALWDTTLLLRWLGVAVYLVMLWTIYIIGGHYMADVIGGSIVALGTIYMVKRIVAAKEKRLASSTINS